MEGLDTMHRRRFLKSLVGVAGLSLPGCMTGTPPATFDLASTQAVSAKRRAVSNTIVVAMPDTIKTLETERILVREKGGELSFLPGAQWSDTLPRLIQTRLIQSFENADIRNVGRPSDKLAATLAVLLDIRAFELDASSNTQAVVSIGAKLVNERSGKVIASQIFSAQQPASFTPTSNATAALDLALGRVLTDIVSWAAKRA